MELFLLLPQLLLLGGCLCPQLGCLRCLALQRLLGHLQLCLEWGGDTHSPGCGMAGAGGMQKSHQCGGEWPWLWQRMKNYPNGA